MRSNAAKSLDPSLMPLFTELERRVSTDGQRLTLRRWMELAEAWRIVEALRECRGNRSAAARALGIGRRTLYTKMEKLGIQPGWGPEDDGSATAPPATSV